MQEPLRLMMVDASMYEYTMHIYAPCEVTNHETVLEKNRVFTHQKWGEVGQTQNHWLPCPEGCEKAAYTVGASSRNVDYHYLHHLGCMNPYK